MEVGNHTIQLVDAILIQLSADSCKPSFHTFLFQFKSSLLSSNVWAHDFSPYFDRRIDLYSVEISTRELSLHLITKMQTFLSSIPPITNEDVSSLELKDNLSITAPDTHSSCLIRKLNPLSHFTDFYPMIFKYSNSSFTLKNKK